MDTLESFAFDKIWVLKKHMLIFKNFIIDHETIITLKKTNIHSLILIDF